MKRFRDIRALIVIGILLFFSGPVLGQEGSGEPIAAEEEQIETKQITGEIISFSPIKNPLMIGIACGEGDAGYDIFLQVKYDDEDEGKTDGLKKTLNDIKYGDTVSVVYDEITRPAEGEKKQVERVVKTVTYLSMATKDIRKMPGKTRETGLKSF